LQHADALPCCDALPQANCRSDWFVGGAQVSGMGDNDHGPLCNLSDETDATRSHGIDRAARSNA